MIYFSIIVAVYNSSQTLYRCINSILNQSFTDFEILLIDDGSTDGSSKICDKYSSQDKRIKVFHKENGGVSSARNSGIRKAQGKYSIHVDSDDYIDPRMLECLHEYTKKIQPDIVVLDYFRDINGKITYVSQDVPSSGKMCIEYILQGRIIGSLWNKLIRHNLYRDYKIEFPQGVNYCEDVYALAHILMHIKKVNYLPQAFYHYEDNALSITRNPDKKIINGRIEFIKLMTSFLSSNGLSINLLEKQKCGIKLSMIKSTYYTRKEFKAFYPNLKFTKNISKKNLFILYVASYSRIGWYTFQILFNLKKTL